MEAHDEVMRQRMKWPSIHIFDLEEWRGHATYDLFKRHVKDVFLTTGTLLDIGFFTGELPIIYEQDGYDVTGIELSPLAVMFAQFQVARFRAKSVKLIQGLFEAYPFKGRFDFVVAGHVLEHAEDAVEFVKKAWSLTEKRLIIILPFDHCHDDPTHLNHWLNLDWIPPLCEGSKVVEQGRIRDEIFIVLAREH